MKNRYIKTSILLIVSIISSCVTIAPPAFINSIPLHEKKRDKMVTSSISEYGMQTSFDYALTNHIGLYYTNLASRQASNNNNIFGKLSYHYFNGIGIGGYKNFGGFFIMELFGGYGLGYYGYHWNSPEKYPLFNNPSVLVREKVRNNSYYHQLLLKGDFGFKFKYISFGMAGNFSKNYNIIRYSYSLEGEENNAANFQEKKNKNFYVPVIFFMNVGLKKYKINAQFGGYTPNFNEGTQSYVSLGLSYSF